MLELKPSPQTMMLIFIAQNRSTPIQEINAAGQKLAKTEKTRTL